MVKYSVEECCGQKSGYGFSLKGPQYDEAWLIFRFIRNLLGCDHVRAGWDREGSSTKLRIRTYWTPACTPLKRLPPTQTKFIAGCESKTPVVQMYFASELPLS